ncbi:MAG: NAD(P)/FAD-dependent oxidoreductase [Clostridia bacterium]|nr:NAD(P)/FAD-dependent oxidoreductase [Clostridia bacterium]
MKTIVVGGGAAGMIAAYYAAITGSETVLIEKNEKLGKKIYITGKGRCNITNNCSPQEFLSNVVSNSKFLYGAINVFSNHDLIELFEKNGLEIKIERGNRVFPQSDKASDVTKVLEKMLKKVGVDIRLGVEVTDIIVEQDLVKGVNTTNGEILCDSIVVCSGGVSYPLTGSTGDGFKFAKKVGHSIVDLRPSLVGVELKGTDFLQMQGVSLKNVGFKAVMGEKTIYSDFGEMLFTHFGVSGPIVLSCSAHINRKDLSNVKFIVDLKPALDDQTLTARLIREFKENNVKNLFSVMRSMLPKSVIDVVLRQAGVSGQKNCSEITVNERERIVSALKGLSFDVKKLRPIDEAIVTAGGINVKEINPKTMESKLIKGLFFAGEVVDLDAYTGGYNLQIAWSTGFVAGENC